MEMDDHPLLKYPWVYNLVRPYDKDELEEFLFTAEIDYNKKEYLRKIIYLCREGKSDYYNCICVRFFRDDSKAFKVVPFVQ